ncbi:MAG: hypothetical protein N2645_18285 [Clostridia bacterium]|nr:hypothetical protein [Clostridia bacterium]
MIKIFINKCLLRIVENRIYWITKIRWIQKILQGSMQLWLMKKERQCKYYEKSGLKQRFFGISGYCKLQKREIYFEDKVGHIPHRFCEGIKQFDKSRCGVYIHFGKDT